MCRDINYSCSSICYVISRLLISALFKLELINNFRHLTQATPALLLEAQVYTIRTATLTKRTDLNIPTQINTQVLPEDPLEVIPISRNHHLRIHSTSITLSSNTTISCLPSMLSMDESFTRSTFSETKSHFQVICFMYSTVYQ